MDIGKYSQELLQGKNAEALKKLADGEDGRRVASMVDVNQLEAAAKAGNTAALGSMLRQILSTPEGRRLAEQVKKAVDR